MPDELFNKRLYTNSILKELTHNKLRVLEHVEPEMRRYNILKLINGDMYHEGEVIKESSVKCGIEKGISQTVDMINHLKEFFGDSLFVPNIDPYPYYSDKQWHDGTYEIVRFVLLIKK